MSKRGVEQSAGSRASGMGALVAAVDLAIAEVRAARERASEAEKRAEQSAAMLRQFVEGEEDPGTLSRRVQVLEAENRDLRRRIERARAGIDRIAASIRFLENRQ
ncbi:MAG: hypothetical protein F4X60_04655 [Gemmatimonadetes bacterium]|nr:hypothetical protein [Gemmatimonadota bacterium]MYB97830.1 hypothetical protein [Gemmatimonadota bacterium]